MPVKLQANGVRLVLSFENRQKNGQEKYKPDQSPPLPVTNRVIHLSQAAGWLKTILLELLTNFEHLRKVKHQYDWESASEEGIRWVPLIQVSSRLMMEDNEIREFHIPIKRYIHNHSDHRQPRRVPI